MRRTNKQSRVRGDERFFPILFEWDSRRHGIPPCDATITCGVWEKAAPFHRVRKRTESFLLLYFWLVFHDHAWRMFELLHVATSSATLTRTLFSRPQGEE
jgi:hypothetical protein